jgi:hypothetical protein
LRYTTAQGPTSPGRGSIPVWSGTLTTFPLASRGAGEEKVALTAVLGQSGGPLEFEARFPGASQLGQQVAAYGGEEVIGLQR